MTTALRITAVKTRSLCCSQCQRSIREGHTVYVIDDQAVCAFCGDPDPAARINRRALDAVTVCKRIKAALKARSGKDWSVTKGRGTAGGWLNISAPKARLGCARLHDFGWGNDLCTVCGMHRNYGYSLATDDERRAFEASCAAHACAAACYGGEITPEDRVELSLLLGLESVHTQGVSVMASTDAYVEYIDRAEDRPLRAIGVPYWD